MAKNSKKLKAYLYAYQNGVKQVDFDYRVCSWYQEGKIVYTDYSKVVAYVDGYRMAFEVKVYTFRNVSTRDDRHRRLQLYCSARPWKYRGWLHHINFYRQADRGKGPCIKQLKF